MNPELAVDLFKTTILFALYIVAPFLITMLVVGLLTSLFQAVTSVQEQTITFAPKLIFPDSPCCWRLGCCAPSPNTR